MRLIVKWLLWAFASIGFLIVASIVGGAIAWWSREDGLALEEPHLLIADWRGGAPEQVEQPRLAELLGQSSTDIVTTARALRRAADDPNVSGLFVRLSGDAGGLAAVAELREAVVAFRASGKPAIAWADDFGGFGGGLSGYLLATAFEEIWLQPLGGVGLRRPEIEAPYLRDALDRWGVAFEVEKRRAFKSAADSLVESAMTAAEREMLEAILASIEETAIEAIAADRGLEPERVLALMERGGGLASYALEAGLIDRIGYFDEAEAAALRAPDAPTLALPRYARFGEAEARPVALVRAVGPITQGSAGPRSAVAAADDIARGIELAIEDEAIEAIVLRVDSPGGSVAASETIARMVTLAREAGKSVVASMSDSAASGGYWIAAPSDRIVAHAGTLTGSIGVVSIKPELSGLWADLGVRWDRVGEGDGSAFSPNRPTSDAAAARRAEVLDEIYLGFVERVAEGRALDPSSVEERARGRVWTGAQALELGLVDRLGGIETALEEVIALRGWPEDDALALVAYPPPKTVFDEIAHALADFGVLLEAFAWAGELRRALVSPASGPAAI